MQYFQKKINQPNDETLKEREMILIALSKNVP